MADRGWKADLNWKLLISNSQAKIYVAKVVGATSSEGCVVMLGSESRRTSMCQTVIFYDESQVLYSFIVV